MIYDQFKNQKFLLLINWLQNRIMQMAGILFQKLSKHTNSIRYAMVIVKIVIKIPMHLFFSPKWSFFNFKNSLDLRFIT